MANIRKIPGKVVGQGANLYNKILEVDTGQWTMGNANKLWRALIKVNRNKAVKRYKPKATERDPALGSNVVVKEKKRTVKVELNRKKEETSWAFTNSISIQPRPGQEWVGSNKVIVYNLSSTPYQYIELQVRPQSLDFKGETTWASIKSMGRNTPMYHYTGAEDTLQFNISWFRVDSDNPDEVVNKCRLLEAWSKADGYKSAPPVLMIQWGDDEADSLFKDHLYILISATYTLSNFCSTAYVHHLGKTFYSDGKLYPNSATQELIFKRVSGSNISYEDIISKDKLERTRGIKSK